MSITHNLIISFPLLFWSITDHSSSFIIVSSSGNNTNAIPHSQSAYEIGQTMTHQQALQQQLQQRFASVNCNSGKYSFNENFSKISCIIIDLQTYVFQRAEFECRTENEYFSVGQSPVHIYNWIE